MTHPYVVEEFTPEEREILLRYFTNVSRPVFALRNLPEIVKGALFARYSRTGKSLRRLFLDEFYRGEDVVQAGGAGAAAAASLYERVFVEFGDDSVAQLGGAHVAVEQASNILTKVIEWGRLAAYLEQSTRYVAYDDMPDGRFRYYREPEVAGSAHGADYEAQMDAIFRLYRESIPPVVRSYEERFPRNPDDPERVYRATIRAKALDALRGMLPAATVSNVGVFASGQALEQMLVRMRASDLEEVREVAGMIHEELAEVIPAFVQRVDQPDRGGAWSDYLRGTRDGVRAVAAELLTGEDPSPRPSVTLVDWDPAAEEKLVASCLYAVSDLPLDRLRERARDMTAEERSRVIAAYVGDRGNRRHRPGRAFEEPAYRFDLLVDYGAFRDLQRHRMLTIDWQRLTPRHGYAMSEDVEEFGVGANFREAMDRSANLWERVAGEMPAQAQYAVCMAYRIRFALHLNAREAMHLIELRSSPQGHASYRAVAHEMHRLIGDVAGHSAVADCMGFVDRSAVDLERLEAERRADFRRSRVAGTDA